MCSAPPQHEARVAREQAQGGGSIINISSIYGHLGARGASVYSASKHAVEGLTSPPRWRLRDQECGSTQSHQDRPKPRMLNRFTGSAERKAGLVAGVPLQRVGEPDEVANAIVCLASHRQSSFTTGQALHVRWREVRNLIPRTRPTKVIAMEQNAQAQAKPIKIPGPEHPISVERNSSRVVVSVAGRVIADTREALTLHEAHYPAFQYIPRKDVDMAQLTRSDSTTYCPYKGDAAYFNIPVGGELSIDAVWSYETPYAAVAGIKDHLAFYPYRADAIEIRS
jgi:uncharacterized protein (DUF427 family)